MTSIQDECSSFQASLSREDSATQLLNDAPRKDAKLSPATLRRISHSITQRYAPTVEAIRQRPAELVLLPIDPFNLHAYWSFDERLHESGSIRLRLICQRDQNGASSDRAFQFDRPVSEKHSHCDVQLPLDGRNYVAELGVIQEVGHFRSLLRSNQIHTPNVGAVQTEPQALVPGGRQAVQIAQMRAAGIKYDEAYTDALVRQSLRSRSIGLKLAPAVGPESLKSPAALPASQSLIEACVDE